MVKLTELEQSVLIGNMLNVSLGIENCQKFIDQKKLEAAIDKFNMIRDETTPKQVRESLVSILDKTIDEFIK